ncbi:alcohol dehydrogenase catalytic domain-containing protein [Nonomuraea sp. NPDC049421]|uniref:alcohol dehydrogenase catalytic domain-containing protein n=1 Tax=Nonomuraea sp. NPDC049421 TaxID=3155275 RepID=UPI00342C9CB5
MRMRAAVLTEFHAPMELREVEIADPGPGEVRVRVKASGVCGSDLKAIDGKSPVAGRLPFILGHESAGVVERTGTGVTTVEEGDPVIIAMNGPCARCRPCQAGHFHLCASPGRPPIIMGGLPRVTLDGAEVRRFIGIGSFAEYAVVPEAMCVKLAPGLPFDAMSLLACGVVTGVGAVLNVARVRPGATVLVVGCGGVGLNVVQGAVLAGATTIVAADVAEGKLKLAERFGATHSLLVTDLPRQVDELVRGGVDHAFDATGAPGVLAKAFAATRPGGTTVMVGSPPQGHPMELDTGLLFASRRLMGTQGGDAAPHRDLPMLAEQYVRGRLDLNGLITERLPLDRIDEAVAHVRAGTVARTVITF